MPSICVKLDNDLYLLLAENYGPLMERKSASAAIRHAIIETYGVEQNERVITGC
jgi:hypothetical protein